MILGAIISNLVVSEGPYKGGISYTLSLGSEKWEPPWTPHIRIILVKRVLIKRETCILLG
jgi:hypothetical protein